MTLLLLMIGMFAQSSSSNATAQLSGSGKPRCYMVEPDTAEKSGAWHEIPCARPTCTDFVVASPTLYVPVHVCAMSAQEAALSAMSAAMDAERPPAINCTNRQKECMERLRSGKPPEPLLEPAESVCKATIEDSQPCPAEPGWQSRPPFSPDGYKSTCRLKSSILLTSEDGAHWCLNVKRMSGNKPRKGAALPPNGDGMRTWVVP